MNNFLYCFDSNYNIPGTCSIYSLLENVSEKINIYIMHKDLDNANNLPEKITQHKMLNKIKVKKVSLNNYNFPNVKGTHISEATYYRLFIEDYLDDEIDFITYLDCDVFSINDPLKLIHQNINKMRSLNSVISVSSEKSLSKYGVENLKMKTDRYFNAGVMIIDYSQWKRENLKNKFLEILSELNDKLLFWDQDILNLSFDGDYSELDNYLNYKVDMEDDDSAIAVDKSSLNNISLLHYSGKFKPWAIKGVLNDNAEYFQKIFRDLYRKKYFISYNYKLNAINDLARAFTKRTIFKTKFPFSFLIYAIKSILKK